MRILSVIPSLGASAGPTTYCLNVSRHLQGHGVDSIILHGGGAVLGDQKRGTEALTITTDWHAVEKAGRIDLIHIHSLWAPLSHQGVRWARARSIPVVYSPHGMLSPWAMKHKWAKKKVAWWLYQRADLLKSDMIHVTAENEYAWVRARGYRKPCVVSPLASELPALSPPALPDAARVRTILFVGRLYPVKGLPHLLRAYSACWSSVPGRNSGGGVTNGQVGHGRWKIVLVGPDQAGHLAELKRECLACGLGVEDCSAETDEVKVRRVRQSEAHVIFTGPLFGANKDEVYRLADLFVLPSFTENFGVVVPDALSHGVPVITTKGTPWSELLGGWDSSKVLKCESSKVWESERVAVGSASRQTAEGPETAKEGNFRTLELSNFRTDQGRCGWWVDIGAEPLAVALREAMALTDEERRAMGANGRRLVEEKYTWSAVAAQMKEAYAWLLGGGTAPDCVRC